MLKIPILRKSIRNALQDKGIMEINKSRLFVASCLALLVTSMTFAIRSKIEAEFTGYGLSKEEIGWAFGPAFWGFTVAMFAGGLIIDIVKTKKVIWAAFIFHLVGIAVLLTAKDAVFLFIANIFIGLGNGSVEASLNPMVATLYPNNKTKMLNRFHVWFPGGIVIGGLLAWILMDNLGLSWQILTSLLFIPLILYGFLFFGQTIPETERVASGVSYKGMLKNVGAPYSIIALISLMIAVASIQSWNIDFSSWTTLAVGLVFLLLIVLETRLISKKTLIFPFIMFCMFLTASTELGTNQWINALLENNQVNQMIILVVVTGIMAVGRFYAGPLIHRLNTVGVLLGSAIVSALGLYLLSLSSGAGATLASAVVFAIGICYFWPTMLGFVAEYIPESGALGLSILGGAGMVATSLILPIMGDSIENAGAQQTIRLMSLLPAVLILLFSGLYFYTRRESHDHNK